MVEELLKLIKVLELNGLKKINLLSLVTNTQSMVVFYCDYNGKYYQSNQLIEETDFDIDVVEQFYNDTVRVIRDSIEFDKNKLNIVKIFSNYKFEHQIENEDEDYFDIEEKWEDELHI